MGIWPDAGIVVGVLFNEDQSEEAEVLLEKIQPEGDADDEDDESAVDIVYVSHNDRVYGIIVGIPVLEDNNLIFELDESALVADIASAKAKMRSLIDDPDRVKVHFYAGSS